MAKKRKREGFTVVMRPSSPFWQINYTNPITEKQVRISSKETIRDNALELAAKMYHEAWGRKHLNEPVGWTVRKLIDWTWDKKWSKKKSANRKNLDGLLKSFLGKFGDYVAKDLSVSEILDYIAERLDPPSDDVRPVSESTVNRELAQVRSAFHFAIKTDRHLENNPLSSIPIFDEDEYQRHRTATKKEREMLIGHSAGLLRDVVEFDFHQGLRKGQIENLRWTDIDLDNRTMRVESRKGRGNKIIVRYVPIFKGGLEVLLRRPRISEHVFCNDLGDKIPRDGCIHAGFPRLVARLGIKDFHFHDIRHTFATGYYLATKDLAGVSNMLCHTNLKTTQRYLNLKVTDIMPSADLDIYQQTFSTQENNEVENRLKIAVTQSRAVSSVG